MATALPRFSRPREEQRRVDAAHLGVARYRFRPIGRELHQSFASGKGAGKSHRFDRGVFHQLNANLQPASKRMENTPSGKPQALTLPEGVALQRTGPRMRGMRFNDYGIARGEG